jgi:lysophospholipase L1-like esterase
VLDWSRPPQGQAKPCFIDGARPRIDLWVGKVAAVHVLLGSNDSYGFGEAGITPPEVFARHLAQVVARFDVPVIVSVPPPNLMTVRALAGYRKQILSVIAAHEHARLGADYLMELPLKYLQEDGVHPTAEGHAVMADLLRPAVAEALGIAPAAPLP